MPDITERAKKSSPRRVYDYSNEMNHSDFHHDQSSPNIASRTLMDHDRLLGNQTPTKQSSGLVSGYISFIKAKKTATIDIIGGNAKLRL